MIIGPPHPLIDVTKFDIFDTKMLIEAGHIGFQFSCFVESVGKAKSHIHFFTVLVGIAKSCAV